MTDSNWHLQIDERKAAAQRVREAATGPITSHHEFESLVDEEVKQVFAACPRCKHVHTVVDNQKMQSCPCCGTNWPRERNGR